MGSHHIAATGSDTDGRRSTDRICLTLTRFPVLAEGVIEPGFTGTVAVNVPSHALDGALLTIPGGAISMPIMATIGAVLPSTDLPECPDELISAELGPCNLTFADYVTVRMPVGNYTGSGHGLKVLRWNEEQGAWVEDGVEFVLRLSMTPCYSEHLSWAHSPCAAQWPRTSTRTAKSTPSTSS